MLSAGSACSGPLVGAEGRCRRRDDRVESVRRGEWRRRRVRGNAAEGGGSEEVPPGALFEGFGVKGPTAGGAGGDGAQESAPTTPSPPPPVSRWGMAAPAPPGMVGRPWAATTYTRNPRSPGAAGSGPQAMSVGEGRSPWGGEGKTREVRPGGPAGINPVEGSRPVGPTPGSLTSSSSQAWSGRGEGSGGGIATGLRERYGALLPLLVAAPSLAFVGSGLTNPDLVRHVFEEINSSVLEKTGSLMLLFFNWIHEHMGPEIAEQYWPSFSSTMPTAIQISALAFLLFFMRTITVPAVRLLYIKVLRRAPADFENSLFAWIFKDVYAPLELLLLVVFGTRSFEGLVAPLVRLPLASVHEFTIPLINVLTIAASVQIALNWKNYTVEKLLKELEGSADTRQYDFIEIGGKIGSILLFGAGVIGALSVIGVELVNLLAVGGFGTLALGLAGRDVLENLFSGLSIYLTQPFKPGEEITVMCGSTLVTNITGIVMYIGWYRTTLKSAGRELYMVPNRIFSSAIVENVSRRRGEFRFLHKFHLRTPSIEAAERYVRRVREVIAEEPKIIRSLHNRITYTKVHDDLLILETSFYLNCGNRDFFLRIQESLILRILNELPAYGLELSRGVNSVVVLSDEDEGGRSTINRGGGNPFGGTDSMFRGITVTQQ